MQVPAISPGASLVETHVIKLWSTLDIAGSRRHQQASAPCLFHYRATSIMTNCLLPGPCACLLPGPCVSCRRLTQYHLLPKCSTRGGGGVGAPHSHRRSRCERVPGAIMWSFWLQDSSFGCGARTSTWSGRFWACASMILTDVDKVFASFHQFPGTNRIHCHRGIRIETRTLVSS